MTNLERVNTTITEFEEAAKVLSLLYQDTPSWAAPLLIDISISLASIADSLEQNKESK